MVNSWPSQCLLVFTGKRTPAKLKPIKRAILVVVVPLATERDGSVPLLEEVIV